MESFSAKLRRYFIFIYVVMHRIGRIFEGVNEITWGMVCGKTQCNQYVKGAQVIGRKRRDKNTYNLLYILS